MFKFNFNWNQATVVGGDGMWLMVRRQGDYRAVPLYYQQTMGL